MLVYERQGNSKDYKGIGAYYKNPEALYAVGVGASNVDIIPYVLLLTKITSRKTGGTYNDIFVFLNKKDTNGDFKYTILKYKKGFNLHCLDVSCLSNQCFVVEGGSPVAIILMAGLDYLIHTLCLAIAHHVLEKNL